MKAAQRLKKQDEIQLIKFGGVWSELHVESLNDTANKCWQNWKQQLHSTHEENSLL
jgi:hypothetical protein